MKRERANAIWFRQPVLWVVAITSVLGIQSSGLTAGTREAVADPEATVRDVTFEMDIQPLLTRYGCNAGACHGKSRGQNGFALSLLGFDSDFDYAALVREGRGRRVTPAAPELSLLLRKATGQVPHGGGVRLDPDSAAYRLIRDWIENGGPRTPDDAPRLVKVLVEPASVLLAPKQSQQVQVWAHYSDGTRRDVTDAAAFRSNDLTIIKVTENGLLQAGPIPGETAIMARYMNQIAVCRAAIPLPGDVGDQAYSELPAQHELDRFVWTKLKQLGMLPSAETDDATFHRRAFLRIIGRQPRPEETRRFLADEGANKRGRLIDWLLQQPEYVDFWANKWADLLRPNPYRTGIKAVWNLDSWLREAFRKNMPYDQMVRQLVTARGSTWKNGATVIYRDRPAPVEIASSVSQLFLGVRLECAKCHHHPFEVWSQDDFYGFASFFARVGHHGGLSPPISGGEEIIYTKPSGKITHERTGQAVDPQPLGGSPLEIPTDVDPRERLAEWMTSPDNPYFAKVMANRVWSELMGRGLVEPVDDLRATNPATNEPLLDFLAEDFRSHGYDIKHLIRTIATSHAFGLSSEPHDRNRSDVNNFSRYYRQRLRAEVLLDAVNDVLETHEQFDAMPSGSRATQLWTYRASSVFLDTFGRPDENQDPPCERTTDSTTPQVLHLMNSPQLNRKLASDDGLAARLIKSFKNDDQLIEEIYLRVYCRPVTAKELAKAKLPLASAKTDADRRRAVEDVLWALLNTPEFVFIN